MASDFEASVIFEDAEWQRAFGQWVERGRKPLGELLAQEMALALKAIILATPPFNTPFDRSFAGQLKIGRGAVERDIRRVYVTPDSGRVYEVLAAKDEDAAKGYWHALKSGRTAEANRILRAIEGLSIERFVDPSLHHRARDKRGRVPRGTKPQAIVRKGALNAYVREVGKRVGEAKAGWLVGANQVGLRGVPGWIRNQPQRGRFRDQRNNPTDPNLEAINHVRYMGAIARRLGIVERALKARIKAMQNKTAALMAKELKK